MPTPISLEYCGHVIRQGHKVTMKEFAVQTVSTGFDVPTVLLVGTSMNAGKTIAGRLVCKELSSLGLNVVGAKLTGAGRYRDIMSLRKAGATRIFDFVDAGLPSTIVPEEKYHAAIRPLLGYISKLKPDFLVAEAGASPLEPYNGAAIIKELGQNIRCTILCASDPYAVVGVQQAFGLKPDLVTGPATDTSAAVDLVMKLTGVQAMNLLGPESVPAFRVFLAESLNLQ